jgi:hypothetical protein
MTGRILFPKKRLNGVVTDSVHVFRSAPSPPTAHSGVYAHLLRLTGATLDTLNPTAIPQATLRLRSTIPTKDGFTSRLDLRRAGVTCPRARWPSPKERRQSDVNATGYKHPRCGGQELRLSSSGTTGSTTDTTEDAARSRKRRPPRTPPQRSMHATHKG